MTPIDRRFERQFTVLSRLIPQLRGPIAVLRDRKWLLLRVPLSLLLIGGGVFSFLPLLGVWMLPLGFLLLAIDIPFLRGPISYLMIRARRRLDLLGIWWRGRRRR